ncbi:MAG: DUF2007 domain-containing protein [Polyangiaceae bacterium]|nr:DUF2007 domain-containing protein [Polyangiaceae bacterium]MCW5789813.1 DUF2007 domain-containing protein [Polyangiaceae bacterium]
MQTVRVASYETPLEAELARAYLGSHGIECRLSDDLLVGTALLYQYALGGVKLHVAAEDESKARFLLLGYHSRTQRAPHVETPEERVTRAWKAAIVGFFLLVGVVHLYSLWLLLRTPYVSLGKRSRRRLWLTVWIDLVGIGIAALLVRGLIVGASAAGGSGESAELPIESAELPIAPRAAALSSAPVWSAV